LKALLGRKRQFKGLKPDLEQFEGTADPKNNSRNRSPTSNILKALLARKRQFEGPKSGLDYLEGAAGPKEAIRGTKALLRIS
jgi:hypothetical protein